MRCLSLTSRVRALFLWALPPVVRWPFALNSHFHPCQCFHPKTFPWSFATSSSVALCIELHTFIPVSVFTQRPFSRQIFNPTVVIVIFTAVNELWGLWVLFGLGLFPLCLELTFLMNSSCFFPVLAPGIFCSIPLRMSALVADDRSSFTLPVWNKGKSV